MREARPAEERVRRHIEGTKHWILLGKLASGLVHEINNPLDGVICSIRSLRSGRLTPEQQDRYLQMAEEELFRIENLTKRLLNLARPSKPLMVPSDVNDLIGKALFFVDYRLTRAGVNRRLELAPGIPLVSLDPAAMLQVFANLLLNAADAMPDGGTLVVRTESNSKRLSVSIADSGVGIPKEHLGRIFDPFFSTKGADGMGLGLPICQSIVEQHGGEIDVTSTVGKGSEFTVSLPAR